jgi:hypothetical protein
MVPYRVRNASSIIVESGQAPSAALNDMMNECRSNVRKSDLQAAIPDIRVLAVLKDIFDRIERFSASVLDNLRWP